MDVRDTPDYLDMRNLARLADWSWRWHQQGGSSYWKARDLRDLRSADQLRQWRQIEFMAQVLMDRETRTLWYLRQAS